jgi:hypothetical protein
MHLLSVCRHLGNCAVLAAAVTLCAHAIENGSSVYPTGVETVLPGMSPAPGGTMLQEFDVVYQTNYVADGQGHSSIPGFHMRVAAIAARVVHNWGVHFLGGRLVSSAGLPFLYRQLDAPFGKGSKAGFGNACLEPLAVAYNKRAWHWHYGLTVYTPGFSYHKDDLVNIGQHNFAIAPAGAFTYLPDKGRTEISSKFQYIVNYANPVTNYHSGHEFIWEYAGMRHIKGAISAGANGYYYQQTTDDRQNGLIFRHGNRGRNFAIGPEVRCHIKKYALIAKYEKEMLAQNKTRGNAFWLQLGVPLGHGGRD